MRNEKWEMRTEKGWLWRFFIIYFLFFISQKASAAVYETLPDFTELPGSNNIEDFEWRNGVTSILSSIIEKGIDITAMLAVIAICIVGLMFITAAGDMEKAKKASKYAGIILVWVILTLSAYAIVALIDKIPNTLRFF